MSRIVNLLVWIAGAALSALGYWCAAVYVFGVFDRGYGQLNWFQLSLYLSMIFMVAGLIGYAAVTVFRQRPRSATSTFLAGAAFTVCVRIFAFALGLAYPDRDMVIEVLAGALVFGALSAFVDRPNAT